MTKERLVHLTHETVRVDLGLSKTQTEAFIDALFKNVIFELLNGVPVVLPGIGKLKVARRPATKTRNPRTKEIMDVPSRRVVRLVTTKGIKDALNVTKPWDEPKDVELRSSSRPATDAKTPEAIP